MTKDEIILAQQARIEQLKSVAENVVLSHNEILPIMNAYMGSMGTEKAWAQTCEVSDAMREVLSTPDDLSALRAHDAELLAPYQWQPIETAPKDGDVILVSHIFNDQIYWVEAAKQKHGAWFRPTGHAVHQPTHWMPLPEMPR